MYICCMDKFWNSKFPELFVADNNVSLILKKPCLWELALTTYSYTHSHLSLTYFTPRYKTRTWLLPSTMKPRWAESSRYAVKRIYLEQRQKRHNTYIKHASNRRQLCLLRCYSMTRSFCDVCLLTEGSNCLVREESEVENVSCACSHIEFILRFNIDN